MRLPVLTYDTTGLPDERAFAEWRALMAPVFAIGPARFFRSLPRGSVKSIPVGDLMANRTVFTAQHLTRDPALIAATPGHLLLQAYTSGGFNGEFAGRPITIGKGMVAVTDLRRTVDVRAATSNTVGVTLPRSLAEEIGADALTPSLDPARNRLLAAWTASFYQRVSRASEADIPALTSEVVTFLARLCDPSATTDTLDGPEMDPGQLARAERLIRAELGSRDISPAWLAERLGLSRATLYRLYAPLGGVMREVQEQRLLAAREALSDALETRSLARVAADLGFSSAALFSRNFRERFGHSPRVLRAEVLQAAAAAEPASPEAVHVLWRDLEDRRRTSRRG